YPDTVKNITRGDIVHYKKSHYLTSNAVVAVAGNVIAEETFEKIGNAFRKMERGEKIEKPKVREAQRAPQVRFKKKDVDQTHVRIGV
ncbi:MAG: insulinase family protein, partial [Patescibacteria group bacterium]